MIKTYEVNLHTSSFNKFKNNDFFIIADQGFKANDFILFKEIETMNEEVKETGLHRMTNIKEVVNDEGLKDGYVLLILTKL